MKKSLIALAVLAASGAAMAQSSVTLFGIVDAGVARLKGSDAHRNGLSTSGLNSSRLGFRGTEDLGGGLSAGFHLEGALNPDDGTGAAAGGGFNFQRRSTVSLNGAFGEVRLGRDYAPSFWNATVFDPFGTVGVGGAQTAAMLGAPVRNSNSVGYFLPGNLGGFYGQAQYAFGENASNTNIDNGNYWGLRGGYAQGPLNVAAAYGKLETGTTLATKGDTKATNLGVSYNFGVATPMFMWVQEKAKVGVAPETKQNAWLIGATAPIGAGEVRAAYSRYDLKGSPNDFRKFSIGYVHNLSKRTALYTTYARVTNKGAANNLVSTGGLSAAGLNTAGRNTSGIEFGVRHSF